MSEPALTTAFRDPVPARWDRLLARLGPGCTALSVPAQPVSDPPGSDAGTIELTVREIFLRADAGERRDLGVVAIFASEHAGRDGSTSCRMTVVGPEAARSAGTGRTGGLTIADLNLGPPRPDIRSISTVVARIPRQPRIRAIAMSIEDLGMILDFEADPVGSAMTALTALNRLEVLLASPGVTVSVAGRIEDPFDPPRAEHYCALLPHGMAPSGGLAIDDGRLASPDANGKTSPWIDSDFVLVRRGPRPPRRELRSLHQLRREHALAQEELGPSEGVVIEEESYTVRAARARQSSRAERIIRLVMDGDAKNARTVFRSALMQPGGDDALIQGLTSRIANVPEYWTIDDALQARADSVVPGPLHEAELTARLGLTKRLDQLLRLSRPSLSEDASPTGELFIPVVTPLVLEVSDELVAVVDSSQDDGRFLYDLIPAMRERVWATIGGSVKVVLPGVRARGGPGLLPNHYRIQVDEADVVKASVGPEAIFSVHQGTDGPPPPDVEVTVTHPTTSEAGLWFVSLDDEAGVGNADRLTAKEYLVHRIELVYRENIRRFLGPQEVDALIDEWIKDDSEGRVGVAFSDQQSRLRLTWVLQETVSDGLPISDWKSILDAIEEAGGINRPVDGLCRALRKGLHHRLPKPRHGELVFRIPEPLEGEIERAAVDGEARLNVLQWLRKFVADNGPAVSLVVATEGTRASVAGLSRLESRLIKTFTSEELGLA